MKEKADAIGIDKRNAITTNNEYISAVDANVTKAWSDTCKQLLAHQNGYWKHSTHSDNDNSSFLNEHSIQQSYFPQELNWLNGKQPPLGVGGRCVPSSKVFMYTTMLGHQCGCNVEGFRLTHSSWVYNNMDNADAINGTYAKTKHDFLSKNPTLRLTKKLADKGATLCFAGDSIDYQIYNAFRSNLLRIGQLYQHHTSPGLDKLLSVMSREIPFVYATKPGNASSWFVHGQRPPDDEGNQFVNGKRPPPGGFESRSMHSILETKAIFKENQPNSSSSMARIRFHMAYGWSPWVIDALDDCNVVIMNFALHYKPYGNYLNQVTNHTLMDDMLAAITYLTNFTSSKKNRIAVWRDALPQHFMTHDGHFSSRLNKLKTKHTCKALSNATQQAYNPIYDDAFTQLCQPPKQTCDQFRYKCTVQPINPNVNYQTPYNFWRDNNCTERIGGGDKDLHHVTGDIYRWKVFNLFDVAWWHSKDMDCKSLSVFVQSGFFKSWLVFVCNYLFI